MAHFHDNALIGASGQGGYQISRSLRFNSADSAYLNRTNSSSVTNNKIHTHSFWIKRSALSDGSNYQSIIGGNGPAGQNDAFGWGSGTSNAGDNLHLRPVSSGAFALTTTQVFRDASAWYHVVLAIDTTQATDTNRVKLYINGSQVTSFSSASYPSQNYVFDWNTASRSTSIGSRSEVGSSMYLNGCMTEIHFIDGQQLTPSSFGETDTITGVWKPKKYAGTYGTNGFYLNFSDNSGTTSTTLGKDSSGNGNNFTPNNFSVTAGSGNDSMIDTPTPYADGGNGRGNYCTWNPLAGVNSAGSHLGTFSNGNLDYSVGASVGNAPRMLAFSSIEFPSSGKWFAEFTNVSNRNVGIIFGSVNQVGIPLTKYIAVNDGSQNYNDGTITSGAATSISTTDVLGVAYDVGAATVKFYKNGTEFIAFGSVTTSTNYCFGSFTNSSASSGAITANFGSRPFAYTPPSGFVALSTQNLPEPSIKKPSSYFDTVIWTGTGSNITIPLGFNADLVWAKRRQADDHVLNDSVRGEDKNLTSNSTAAEFTSNYGLNFISTGNSIQLEGTGYFGGGGGGSPSFVAWCWDESATPGFDIVTYTGTGSATTVAHSLGVAPSMIVIKCRSNGSDWATYHTSVGATKGLGLNLTNAAFTTSDYWNNTAPTSSAFTVGTNTDLNGSGRTYVAYLWSEVAGFSKFGSYTGNGSSDGVYIHLGFTPAVVIVKQTNSANDWVILDNRRDSFNSAYNSILFPNSSVAENSGANKYWDSLSNGIKIRGTSSAINGSGSTYVFCAWAETPAKFSLAR